MKKFVLIVFLIFFKPLFAFSVKGTANTDLELEFGSLLYHITDAFSHKQREGNYFFKPTVMLSKQGLIAAYFKNSHSKDSVVIGVRRYWSEKKVDSIRYQTGYSVGIIKGYCTAGGMRIYEDCTSETKSQLAPYGQLFLKARKDNVSINIAYSVVLLYATLSFYLD